MICLGNNSKSSSQETPRFYFKTELWEGFHLTDLLNEVKNILYRALNNWLHRVEQTSQAWGSDSIPCSNFPRRICHFLSEYVLSHFLCSCAILNPYLKEKIPSKSLDVSNETLL